MFIRCVVSILLAAVTMTVRGAETQPANSAMIRVDGRVWNDLPEDSSSDESSAVTQTAAYPAVRWLINVEGSRLSIDARCNTPNNSVDVIVDGGKPRRVPLAVGQHETELWSGAVGRHQIEVHKRNEAWQGIITISRWHTDGQFLDPPPPAGRRLLFIGDSITSGSGIDAVRDDPTNDASLVSNGRLTYARQLAERLDADAHLVAYGGRGLVRDWQNVRDTNNAPIFYDRTLPDDAGKPWDPSRFIPDAVSICLGTNDFNHGIPQRREWVDAMTTLIQTIRTDFPNVPVILITSPMQPPETPERNALRDYLKEIAGGLQHVHVAQIGHYPGRTVDSHPIAEEHQRIADELEPVLRRVLGW